MIAARKPTSRLLVALAALVACVSAVSAESTVHTVITTECGEYFSWQSLGMLYSHRKSGQPGPLTRIMCCTPKEWEELSDEAKNIMPTHVAPSFTHHPRTGDEYSAYNKPVAVIDWLARNDVKEDYVLIIDADMIMREPFVPDAEGARPGRAVSAFFGYMKGVNNKLAIKHIPEITPRNDTLAGPKGRRSDMVGGFTMMNTADLKRVAPLWLKYTEDVRFDPDAWELSGDAYSVHPGDKPWISEMYGYSYACAKSDVWHITHRSAMLYPAYETSDFPKVLHYGLYFEVAGTKYKFDKHWHYDFNPFKCPPWKLGKGGLFDHPPAPGTFKTTGDALLRDLLAIQVPVILNAAFCEHHRKNCPPSVELERECGRAEKLERELDVALAKIEAVLPDPCHNADKRCDTWAEHGECDKNMGYMMDTCPLACGTCRPRGKRAPAHRKLGVGGGVGPVKTVRSPPRTVEQVHGRPAVGKLAGGSLKTPPIVTEATGRHSRTQVLEDMEIGDDDVHLGAEHQVRAQQAQQEVKEVKHLATSSDGRIIHLDDDEDEEFEGGAGENMHHGEGGHATSSDGKTIDLDDDGDDDEAGEEAGGVVSELKLRCTRFPAWSMSQVRRCMALAAEGKTYDPANDDGSTDDLHSKAHRLLERTNTMGRLLEEGIKEKVHNAEDAAKGMGPMAMLGWAGGLLAVLTLVMRGRSKKSKGKVARRHFLLARYGGRAESRDD